MNNRIDDFYKKAVTAASSELANWNKNWEPGSQNFDYEKVLYSKFAELIVKECIYTIQLQMVRNGNNTPENIRSLQHINDLGAKFGITFPMDYSG